MKKRISNYRFILIFLMAVLFTGCYEVNTPKKNSGFVLKRQMSPLIITEIDSCEYFFGNWGSATVLTHKGNCKFCLERNKK